MTRTNLLLLAAIAVALPLSLLAGRVWIDPFHPVLAGLRQTARARLDPGLFYCGGPSIPRAMTRLAAIRGELANRP